MFNLAMRLHACYRLPLFSFQRSMQTKPNFTVLTPFLSGCQQQYLSKNLLWVAGCLSNEVPLNCQGVFQVASNAALLCKSLAFVCEIKCLVKAPIKKKSTISGNPYKRLHKPF
jgi:hypothetical protein